MRVIKFKYIWKSSEDGSYISRIVTLDDIQQRNFNLIVVGYGVPIARVQFTGCTSENGVEIYEGDLVRARSDDQVASVYFDEDRCGFLVDYGEWIEIQELGSWCIPVGNIYEV